MTEKLDPCADERAYLGGLVAAAEAEAAADPTAVTNAQAIADAIAAGVLRPQHLQGADPVSAAEYEAAQRQGWERR